MKGDFDYGRNIYDVARFAYPALRSAADSWEGSELQWLYERRGVPWQVAQDKWKRLRQIIEKSRRTATDRAVPEKKRSYSEIEEVAKSNNNEMPNNGINRIQWERKVVRGRKKYRPQKILNAFINTTEQCLGLRSQVGPLYPLGVKHLVSEFNPTTAGMVSIGLNSDSTVIAGRAQPDATPMHIYDLNYYVGATEDHTGNWPTLATNQNDDINARAWYWKNTNKFTALENSNSPNDAPRWYINEPLTLRQDENPSAHIYRKGIDIKYQFYGTTGQTMEYDISVIRIHVPWMCPDYDTSLATTSAENSLRQFQQNWQNLVRALTINPLLAGVEPGPQPSKRWFTKVASKRIRLTEQNADIQQLPVARGSIHVKINENQNYSWAQEDFVVESGDNAYDNVPNVDDNGENNAFVHKPYYTSRYYLLIRAVCPQDLSPLGSALNLDGTTITEAAGLSEAFVLSRAATAFTPSYDLICRTFFKTIN